MFTLIHTIPVNTEEPTLNRAQIWQGLLLKAANPVPFLDAMSACTVIDRGHGWSGGQYDRRCGDQACDEFSDSRKHF